jgi:hypothetical protein
MNAASTGGCAVLRQWNPLDPPSLDARRLELDVETAELGMRGQPTRSGGPDATDLLLVDHLERVAELGTTLLFDLDDEDAPAAPEHEVELVAADAHVRCQQAVAPESVVVEGAALAAVHAASTDS